MRLHMRNNAGAASAAEVLYEPKKRRQIVPVSTAGAVNDSAAQLVGLQLRRRPFMQPPPQGPVVVCVADDGVFEVRRAGAGAAQPATWADGPEDAEGRWLDPQPGHPNVTVPPCHRAVSAAPLRTPPVRAVSGFVTRDGPRLMLDGGEWFFGGTNWFQAAVLGSGVSDSDVWRQIGAHAALGARVLRVFAFSNGGGASRMQTPRPLQVEVGAPLQEDALRRLDLVLAAAAAHGVRLILPLANFEPELGGMQWYVDQVLGPGYALLEFYTHADVRAAYRSYVRRLIGRVNSITGVRYAEEPAVLAWELANEPHTADRVEHETGIAPGSTVTAWLDEMSRFVRSLGVRQLIASGEEGYRSDGPHDSTIPHFWLSDGLKGADFAADCGLTHIDIMTIHVYPDNWNIPTENYTWVVENFMTDRAAVARRQEKPIVLEEFGVRQGYLPTRDEFFTVLGRAAVDLGFAGTLSWQVSAKLIGDGWYGFDYNDDGAQALLRHWAAMNAMTEAVKARQNIQGEGRRP